VEAEMQGCARGTLTLIELVGRAKTISPLSDKKEASADEGLHCSASRGQAMHGYKDGVARNVTTHLTNTLTHSEC
jgi:hypothetical protein